MASSPDSTVFVVDDDPAMRDSLRWLLESAGLAVETFPTAEAFLDRSQWPARAGCLVLDVRLPGMDGLELQKELRAREVDLPVILVSAYTDPDAIERAQSAGARAFFRKPFDDQLLLDAVAEAISADRHPS